MNDSDRRKQAAQNSGTFIALAGLLLFGGLVLLMISSVLPAAIQGFVAVFLIISGMLCFHYFTWGRSMELSDRRKREADPDS